MSSPKERVESLLNLVPQHLIDKAEKRSEESINSDVELPRDAFDLLLRLGRKAQKLEDNRSAITGGGKAKADSSPSSQALRSGGAYERKRKHKYEHQRTPDSPLRRYLNNSPLRSQVFRDFQRRGQFILGDYPEADRLICLGEDDDERYSSGTSSSSESLKEGGGGGDSSDSDSPVVVKKPFAVKERPSDAIQAKL